MRNRTGVSDINRRKFVAQTKKSTPVTKPVVSEPNTIVPASNEIATNRLVAAGPNAHIKDGSRPQSTDITGNVIKTDDEGRMSLDEIEKMGILEQLGRGSVVPTEQMVGIVKDVAYGVKSEDQATMESGLDLIINPLIKPFVDPRMVEAGVVTQSNWYWPEELKADWKVLPEFMQKGSGHDYKPETRSFVDGMGGFFGNVGAVVQSDLGNKIRDEEFATSAERFERAPGYYIGSAIGELPYMIVGGGQIKAVATISAKATAGAIRGTVRGTAGLKLVNVAYKIEQTAMKLEKLVGKTNKVTDKVTDIKTIIKSKDVLIKGLAKNTAVQKKLVATLEETKKGLSKDETQEIDKHIKKAKDLMKSNKKKSTDIDKKFGRDEINDINNIDNIVGRTGRVEKFNNSVKQELLPELKIFKDEYVAQSIFEKIGTKTNSLASFIEGSPGNVGDKVDRFLNRPGRAMGDAMTEKADQIFKERILKQAAEGRYSGIMGNVILNKDIWGNVVKSRLGMERSGSLMNKYAGLLSRTVPMLRVIDSDAYQKIGKAIDEEKQTLTDQNLFLNKQLKLPMDELPKGGDKFEIVSKMNKNLDEMKKLDESKVNLFEPMSYTSKHSQNRPSKSPIPAFAGTTSDYRFDFDAFSKAFPSVADKITSQKINIGARPDVSIRKVHGIIMGEIAGIPSPSGTIGGYTFWINKMGRKEAGGIFGGEKNLSKNKSWIKNIGLRRVGRFRTLIPKKKEQMEDVVYLYKADDSLMSTSGKSASVENIITVGQDTLPKDLELIQTQYFAEPLDSTHHIAKMFPNRKVFRYKRIEQEKIKNVIENTNAYEESFVDVRINTLKPKQMEPVGDILQRRAMAENRPEQAMGFVDQEIEMIGKQKELVWNKYDVDTANLNYDPLGTMDPASKASKQYLIKQESTKELEGLEARLFQLKKSDRMDEMSELSKQIDIHTKGTPRGTIFSMPVETLIREDQLLKNMYETEMIIDNVTKKKYYKRTVKDEKTGVPELKMFEVIDDSFNPSSVTSSDFVNPQLNERQFIPGQRDSSGNTIYENVPVFPNMSAQVDESKHLLKTEVNKNTIFINQPETYEGILKPLSSLEVDKLQSGTNLGKLLSQSKGSLSLIDTTTPKRIRSEAGGTVAVHKTKAAQVIEYGKVTIGQTKVQGLQSLADTKKRLEDILIGERFSKLSTQDFRPDTNTYQQRIGKGVGELTQGTSSRVTGYDTKLRAMLGVGDDPELVQGAIPPAVKVNPVYDHMTYLHQVVDLAEDVQGKGNKSKSKFTVYEQLLTKAKTDNVERGFKERMAQLYKTNVKNEIRYSQKQLDELFINDENKYISEIESMVNTPNNKFLRKASSKEIRILKGKNSAKKDNIKLIDYEKNFPEINVIDTRNFISRSFADLKSQMVRSGPEFFQRKSRDVEDQRQQKVVYDNDGKELPGPNVLNRFLRSISKNIDKPGSKVVTEYEAGPGTILSIKKALSNPQIQNIISSDKYMSKLQLQVGGVTQTSSDAALSRMQKSQSAIIGKIEEKGVDIDRLEVYATDVPTDKSWSFDVIDAPGGVGDDMNLSYADRNTKNTFINELRENSFKIRKLEKKPFSKNTYEKITDLENKNKKLLSKINKLEGGLRGSPTEYTYVGRGTETPMNTRPSQARTDLIVKAMIYKHLNVPMEASTAADRSSNNSILLALIDAGVTETKLEGIFKSGSASTTSSNINAFFKTTKGKDLLGSTEFQQAAKTQNEAKTIMSQMSDKTASQLNDRVFGYSSRELSELSAKKPDSVVGLRQQATSTSTLASNIGNLFSDNVTTQQPSQSQSQQQDPSWVAFADSSPTMAKPEAPVNLIDQTIGDIQKTMSGIVKGNSNIGDVSEGMTVKSYQAPSSLTNLFSSESLIQEGPKISSTQTPNLLEGLKINTSQEGGTLVIPNLGTFMDEGFNVLQEQRQTQAFAQDFIKAKPDNEVLLKSPMIVTPKPIPQRILPITPVIPLFNPVKAALRRRRAKPPKSKKKKTWWQTPENWYEPYYWGGKNQEGAGYVTFTGKEPAKVKKYEKKFFGIGVNDSPFGVRSKWF